MKKIKKLVAVMLLSLTLFNTTFNSYTMAVQAAELVPVTMTVLEALLALFGVEIGIGNQSGLFGQSEFTDFVDAVADGHTVDMPMYGEVNFSDGESLLSWLTWAQRCHSKVSGNEMVDVAFNTSIMTLSKALDILSYSNTGTSATNSMRNKIDILKDYYDTATDFVGEVRDAFKVASGSSDDKKMTATRWDIITGMLSTFFYGTAEKINDYVGAISLPDNSAYDDLSDILENADGYSGELPVYAVSFDSYYASGGYSLVAISEPVSSDTSATFHIISTSLFKDLIFYAVLCSDTEIEFRYMNESGPISSYPTKRRCFKADTLTGVGQADSARVSVNAVRRLYVPLFNSSADAYQYFYGEVNPALLLNADTTYSDFKSETASASDTLTDMIKALISAVPSVDDFVAAVPGVLEAADDAAGKEDSITAVNSAIAELAGIKDAIDDSQEQDNANTNSILSAIGALALNWKELFKWLDDFWTWLQNTWAELVALIGAAAVAGHPNGSVDSDDSSSSSGSVSLINGLIMLISIFFILLRIFLHLLEFIINVFRIPADPGFITGDFAVGFNYIKSVQLAPLSISIYDFLMGLVHILLLFSVVKVLKKHIDRIHM